MSVGSWRLSSFRSPPLTRLSLHTQSP
uniref:Upstream orf n=1 Tax=Emericella nidulans TaxID=162425 RepID=V9H013_EMEND|nr:upstream orf [Aspergillus nidulans]